MFQIKKEFNFEAGHALDHHDGKCKMPHGHSYKVLICLHYEKLIESGPKKNMAIDFHDLSALIKPMVSQFLDHCWLNSSLESDSPTAEYIAAWIYQHLKKKLKSLYSVTVWETSTSSVTFCPQS